MIDQFKLMLPPKFSAVQNVVIIGFLAILLIKLLGSCRPSCTNDSQKRFSSFSFVDKWEFLAPFPRRVTGHPRRKRVELVFVLWSSLPDEFVDDRPWRPGWNESFFGLENVSLKHKYSIKSAQFLLLVTPQSVVNSWSFRASSVDWSTAVKTLLVSPAAISSSVLVYKRIIKLHI